MLAYGFMQNAFLVSLCIAILCPCIGIFLVLRRYSMIGDTLSHASLAGVSIGLLVNQNPLLCAFLFTSACGILIEFLRKFFQKYTDLILSIVLAFSVGIAITIMSSGKLHANAESFLFGSILTVSQIDIAIVLLLTALSVAALYRLYHQMLYIAFDEETAILAGVRVKSINYVFSVLVAAAIAVSIRIVGVLVLSSMIALPVATALQIGKGFKVTVCCSIACSVVDILLGLILSYYLNVAPGGFTALVSVFVLLTVMLIKAAISRRKNRESMKRTVGEVAR